MPARIQKINWDQVESSNVDALFFDERSGTICVRFINGGLYSYIGATQEVYSGLRMAPSIGRYLNNVIKSLPYTRWETEEDLLSHLNI